MRTLSGSYPSPDTDTDATDFAKMAEFVDVKIEGKMQPQ